LVVVIKLQLMQDKNAPKRYYFLLFMYAKA